MIRFAVRRPGENATSIVDEGFRTVGLSQQSNTLLGRFGVSANPKLITVTGRVLNEPKVFYKNNNSASVRFGSWNMINIKFNTAGSLKKWSFLLIAHDRPSIDLNSLKNLMQGFYAALNKVGIATAAPMSPKMIQMTSTEDPKLENEIRGASTGLDFLFIILPESNIPLYNRIKHLADVKYGIHTVCAVAKKITKPQGQEQYFANLALKVNLKLGGINQLIDSSRVGLINEDKTMVVGLDVTHPSPGSSLNAPSVAGMVASTDKWLGQWPGILRIQTGRQESVADLADMIESRLKIWKAKRDHHSYPENILLYRDGVSEGQYQKVLDEEVPRLREGCKRLYPAPDQKKGLPRLTIVICGKRHHTRFYPTTETEADRSSNCKPGTVVDRGVTEARNWDFFLQAHAAIQGTARPSHYYVILDEIFRTKYKTLPPGFGNVADILEDVTHSMCYLFGRATKAVSLCPPAYYADIMCERARCYLSSLYETPANSAAPSIAGTSTAEDQSSASANDVAIHQRLKDTMFYI
jgi:eukaryotic translation initiation factor 2C